MVNKLEIANQNDSLCYFNEIPSEMAYKILSFLPTRRWSLANTVCLEWNAIITHIAQVRRDQLIKALGIPLFNHQLGYPVIFVVKIYQSVKRVNDANSQQSFQNINSNLSSMKSIGLKLIQNYDSKTAFQMLNAVKDFSFKNLVLKEIAIELTEKRQIFSAHQVIHEISETDYPIAFNLCSKIISHLVAKEDEASAKELIYYMFPLDMENRNQTLARLSRQFKEAGNKSVASILQACLTRTSHSL